MIASRIAVTLAVVLSAGAASADEIPPADSCIQSWGTARFNGSGYTHRVHISNVCAAPASCIVTTDVNPQPMPVVAAPMSDIDVTTFLDSPASVFVGRVECTMPTEIPSPSGAR